ncbi:MAG: TM2 domain-containing membrane protein YozV [Janthinobacterium sp.]
MPAGSTFESLSDTGNQTHQEQAMKGQVLDYSVPDGSGVISASDGVRFNFSGAQWKGDSPPVRGMWVDFDVSGNDPKDAVAIYRSLSAADALLCNIAGPATGKSKAAATLWAIFLGGFGAHKFYMGSWGWGVVYLLTCWLYIPFIAALIEWIRYVLMTDNEFAIKSEAFKSKGPFGFFW